MSEANETLITRDHSRTDSDIKTFDIAPLPKSLGVLWRYWGELDRSHPGVLPKKTDMHMAGLHGALPHIVISERTGDFELQIRLSGTAVENRFGLPITGKNLLDLTPPAQRDLINSVYSNISTHRCGFYIREILGFNKGKSTAVQALILPLADAGGKPHFFIGSYHFGESHFDDKHAPPPIVEHWHIERFGYIDLGYGLPAPS